VTGQVVKRAWSFTLGCWFVAVLANLLLVLADQDIRALLIVRGLAAGAMLTGLAVAVPLTLWWLVARRGRSSSVER
jgi:hypothetical protein